jgi:cell division protein FtsW (lipid II flippase)
MDARFVLPRQLLWLGIGAFVMLVTILIPFRVFESLAYAVYGLCLLLLVVVLILPARGETQRWLIVGPLAIQPSEFTKVAVILVCARAGVSPRQSQHAAHVDPHPHPVPRSVFMVLKQPDLGTAMVFVGILLPCCTGAAFADCTSCSCSPIVSTVLIIYGEDVTRNA